MQNLCWIYSYKVTAYVCYARVCAPENFANCEEIGAVIIEQFDPFYSFHD